MESKEERKRQRLCEVCGERGIFMKCDGCGILLCSECLKYSLYGTGCGCIQPVVLCPACDEDW